MLAAVRPRPSLPLDLYIEAPDDMGGFVRTYDCCPRSSAPPRRCISSSGCGTPAAVYPTGGHLEDVAVSQAREKVRRADASPSAFCATSLPSSPRMVDR